MSLQAGHKLAHYEILELVGRGGMGEVYRAKDSKLDRDVAIKVLPDEFAQDEERLRRFQREAKVLASLNHPNIAAIYGLEQSGDTHYLVLELVPGETLADRIARGRLSVEEALEIAKKIAEAMEEAHERGIVHRDLKPANVKLTPDDKVKVLDFGLAKAFAEEGADGNASTSMSPTITRDATRIGVILGTAAYMSPEQAKGKRVDRRADVWAFGVVLYEMLTGKRAFQADDVSETLAHVLAKEPDWESLPKEMPIALSQAVRACLVKDPKLRVRDIGDVRLVMSGTFERAPEPVGKVRGSLPSWAIVAALALAIFVGTAVWHLKPEPSLTVAKFRSRLPTGVTLSPSAVDLLAVSRDGRQIVYSTADQLYLRAIEQFEAVPLRDTEGGVQPFFSPDGEWIGFVADEQLKKIPSRGGAPVSLCDARNVWGAWWADDNTIVFSVRGTGIMRVSANGGTPELVIPIDAALGFSDSPQVLPGTDVVLFTLGDAVDWDAAQIVAQSPGSSERKLLIRGGRGARYLSAGYLAYVRQGTLFAAPFDIDRMEVTGNSSPIAEGVTVARGFSGAAQFDVSDAGTLVYITGDARRNRTLVWVDRSGNEELVGAEPRSYTYPRISPDGTQLALDIRDQEEDIWIWHFERKTLRRFTFSPGMDSYPSWSPDGSRLAFASAVDGLRNLYSRSADGTGALEQLTETDTGPVSYGFSPDGSRIIFRQYGVHQSADIGMRSSDGSVSTLVGTEYWESNAEISPNGELLAYESNESGRDEVYVRPFPNVDDGRWQVSTNGGSRPVWARDGRELFYLSADRGLVACRVQIDNGFSLDSTETLFDANNYVTIGDSPGRTYDVSPDGDRFLMIRESERGASSVELVFVLNWFEELKRLAPTNN